MNEREKENIVYDREKNMSEINDCCGMNNVYYD